MSMTSASLARASRPMTDWKSALRADPIPWLLDNACAPIRYRALAELLDSGDLVIDGGNSNYRETVRRAATLADAGIALYAISYDEVDALADEAYRAFGAVHVIMFGLTSSSRMRGCR